MLLRLEMEEREVQTLASYATPSAASAGRAFAEAEHPYRLCFQRDRDRIIHSTAFRRLEYKTQVFVNHEGDHNRTRLTHTIEVAQIARTISRAMKLNEDLTEAIALAHDLGHTPFGHTGETVLDKLMAAAGGFEHNKQGLRVVDLLEYTYPDLRGLNLTYEVREAILKHNPPYADHPFKPSGGQLTLEAQVVDLADEIAYNSHDLDDGLNNKLLSLEKLGELEIWQESLQAAQIRYPQARPSKLERIAAKSIIGAQVADTITYSLQNLENNKIKTPQQVRDFPRPLIDMNPQMKQKNLLLKKFLYENMYQHYKIIRMSSKSAQFLTSLFEAFVANPKLLPTWFQRQITQDSLPRVVSDYIAGMTDRYALEEYRKIFQPYEK